MKLLNQLEMTIQNAILPKLKPYYNKISMDNGNRWMMQVWYCDKTLFESFETYELDSSKQEEAFEEKKLRLFLDGVILYYVQSNDIIKPVCNASDEYFDYH